MTLQKNYPWILVIGSLIGLLASFFLMLDTIKIIEDPGAEIPCNINPFISCSNAINSSQGEVFGFPNPILGIISFSVFLTAGVSLAFGAKSNRKFWLLINLGLLASTILVLWFFYQSLYYLGSLCIYCMTIWSVTWPIFLYTTIWNHREGHFLSPKINKFIGFLDKYSFQALTLWYAIMIMLILLRFRDFFLF